MEKFKLKFQEFKEKCQEKWRTLKKKCKITYLKAKFAFRKMVSDFEYKHGYSQRCNWCEDNIFCDVYQGSPAKKHFWEVKRCADHHSTR